MAKGLWVKVKPQADAYGSATWKTVSNIWVKTTPTSWQSVSDAWVKVKPASDAYGTATWKALYSAGTAPDTPIEILDSYTTTDLLRLQGKNYHWSPTPTTLQYQFAVVDQQDNMTQVIVDWTTTSNPSTGTSITVPGSSSYITIQQADTYIYPGTVNVFQFNVRGTTASGLQFTYKDEFNFRTPKAPTLTYDVLSSTSIRLNISSYSTDDYIATGRYIIYAWDGTAFRRAGSTGGIVGLGGYAADSQLKQITISGLSLTKTYEFYVLPVTGTTGTTDTNYSGYSGLEATISNVTTDAGPKPPTSFTATTTRTDGVLLEWSGASGTITGYDIYWASTSAGPNGDGNLNTISVSPDFNVNTTNTSGSYLDTGIPSGNTRYYWIRAINSTYTGQWTPVNGGVMGTRVSNKPVNTVAPSITGTIKEGQTVTFNAGTWTNSPTSYTFEVGWEGTYDPFLGDYPWNSVATFSGVTSSTMTYTIAQNWRTARGTNIRIMVTASNADGYNIANSPQYTVASGLEQYTFNFGNTLYIGTNGYIAFDSGQTADAVSSTSGRVLAVIPRDLRQSGNVYYWSDTAQFIVKYVGYNYDISSQSQVYEVTFYNGQQYADVYVETSYSAASTPGAYFNNGIAMTNYSSALSAGQARRVYFTGSSPVTVSYSPKSTGVMLQASLTSGSTDQGYTAITTATNQYSPAPSIITAPSVTPTSGTLGSTTLSVTNGTWNGSPYGFTYYWYYLTTSGWNGTGVTSSTYTPPASLASTSGFLYTFYCRVTAQNLAGSTSADSNSVSLDAPVVITKLSTPTGVNASDDRSDGVLISWNPVSNAAYYGVWWGGAPGYDSLADFGGNRDTSLITGTSYLDTAISSGSSRDYYVQAYRSGDPAGTKSDWGGPNNGTRVASNVITYSACYEYSRTTDYNYCIGNARSSGGTVYNRRDQYTNGSFTAYVYDCASTTWSTYDPYGCYTPPQTCVMYTCLQYDVSDPASPNYVGHCYTLGACDAPLNNDGKGRSCCQYG